MAPPECFRSACSTLTLRLGLCSGSVASSLEVDEDTVTFKKAHPLAGTVFYDKFKDTGTYFLPVIISLRTSFWFAGPCNRN